MYKDSEFMITSPNGKAFGPFGINKVINSLLENCNLHHISPHGLRPYTRYYAPGKWCRY